MIAVWDAGGTCPTEEEVDHEQMQEVCVCFGQESEQALLPAEGMDRHRRKQWWRIRAGGKEVRAGREGMEGREGREGRHVVRSGVCTVRIECGRI